MSKTNPNQDRYKIGGRAQTDGADRANDLQREKQEFARIDQKAHPAVKRSAKKK